MDIFFLSSEFGEELTKWLHKNNGTLAGITKNLPSFEFGSSCHHRHWCVGWLTFNVCKNLNLTCNPVFLKFLFQCFFPHELIKRIKTPFFILNPGYDFWQVSVRVLCLRLLILVYGFSIVDIFKLLLAYSRYDIFWYRTHLIVKDTGWGARRTFMIVILIRLKYCKVTCHREVPVHVFKKLNMFSL